MDKATYLLEFEDNGQDKEYKVEAICNDTVYAKKSERDHLPDFYYLVLWKDYLEEENTWETTLAIHHLQKLLP